MNDRSATRLGNNPAEILIVDDNTFNVYSLKMMVEEFFKIKCDVAYSGKEAIDMVV